MKRKVKRVFVILTVIVLILAALFFWQRNNLKALLFSARMSSEELTGSLEQNAEKLTEQSASVSGITVRPPSEEEKQALRDNTLSGEELIERLIVPEETPAPTGAGQTASAGEQTAAPAEIPDQSADRDELARLIARIYVLQAQYNAWLEEAGQDAVEEFRALPEEERTTQKKFSIGMKYTELALAKEKECDAKMAEIENSVRAVLSRLGESTELADQIHEAYLEEKALKKAYYLNKF